MTPCIEGLIGPAPAVVGYQTTTSSTRASFGSTTDCFVIVIVRTPASNGPRTRTLGARARGPVDDVVAEVQIGARRLVERAAVHAQAVARLTLQDTGTAALGFTLPQGDFVVPHEAFFTSRFMAVSHSWRRSPATTVLVRTFFAQCL